jgi:hypothetical protein
MQIVLDNHDRIGREYIVKSTMESQEMAAANALISELRR